MNSVCVRWQRPEYTCAVFIGRKGGFIHHDRSGTGSNTGRESRLSTGLAQEESRETQGVCEQLLDEESEGNGGAGAMPRAKTFYRWAIENKRRFKDPDVLKLIQHMKLDDLFPRSPFYAINIRYLIRRGACDQIVDGFKKAWQLFLDDTRRERRHEE
jgi:hypothetical protein